MNGAATRRSMSPTAIEGASLEQSFAENVSTPQPQTRGRSRGKSLARGLPVQVAYATIDAILVCTIGATVLWARFGIGLLLGPERQLFDGVVGHAYVGVFLLYSALVVMGCASQALYRTPRDRSVLDESLMVAKAVGLATSLLVLFIFTSGYHEASRLVVASAGALNVVALSGWRYFKRRFVLRRTAEGIGVSRVLIVGAGRMGMALAEWLQRNPHMGYSVCGFLDDQSSDPRVLGKLSDLRHLALTQFVDELFITFPSDRELVKTMVFEARQLRLGLKIVPDIYDGLGWRAPLHMMGGFPVMDLHWQPIPAVGLAVKRVLDILVSGFALIVTAPLLAILAILIRVDSFGPSLYVADRVGLKGRRFRCYKLRTMVADANFQKENLRSANDRRGPFFKMENDPRITHLGWWLRKYSLDELPQLWNVLRGDMSLVGPRPHPIDDYERYAVEHLRRLDVSPGLTGLWQVTARSDPSFETNMALDLEYIENWTLGLDLAILLKTVPALLRAEGR
jgi:exopolysaccharide biosynthesis polyprenyl glycosylphosphotransferase